MVASFRQAQEALQQCTGELKLFLRFSKPYNHQTALNFFDRPHAECFMQKLTANHNTGQIHLRVWCRFCRFWHWRGAARLF